MVKFGIGVRVRDPHPREDDLQSLWSTGLWLGRDSQSDEHVVGTPTGMRRSRAVKLLPENESWSAPLFQGMVWTPWHTSEAHNTFVYTQGWTPTEGCPACEEDVSGHRRRGRPKCHTPACLQRRAEMRAGDRQRPCQFLQRRPDVMIAPTPQSVATC